MHLTFGPVFVPGNSTAGGAEETSSTVGIVGTTGAGGGGGSAAGSPGSAPQVLVFLFRCCDGTLILLCRGNAQHVGMSYRL